MRNSSANHVEKVCNDPEYCKVLSQTPRNYVFEISPLDVYIK